MWLINFLWDSINKAASTLGVALSTTGAAVSFFTIGDIAGIIGILSTAVLSWLSYSKHKQQKVLHALQIEKVRLENEALRIQNNDLKKTQNGWR